MKVALCLSGKVGNTIGKSGNHKSESRVLQKGFEHYKRHIIDKNNVDIFVHCWDKELEQEVKDLYKPKRCTFEDQIYFEIPDYVTGEESRKNNHYSRWYSNYKVNQLRKEYEEQNNFEYDFVMTTRFDLAWETDVDFSKYENNSFYAGKWSAVIDAHGRDLFKGGRGPLYDIIDTKHPILDSLKLVEKGYPHTSDGFLDLWFFSNSKNSTKFFDIYNQLDEYTKPNACPNDASGRISNHQLVKYHLQKIDLLDKVKFEFHMFDDFPEVRRKYFGCRK